MKESGARPSPRAIRAATSAFSSGCQRAGSPHVIPVRFKTRLRPEATSRCARGEFPADLDTRPLATVLISQIEGAILLMKTHRHAGPIEAGVRTMLRLLER